MRLNRSQLEAVAERAADAVIAGRLELAGPLAVLIEAIDACDPDPDLEAEPDLEEQHDAEGRCWGSGATPDQYRLTYDISPDLTARSFGVLPPDVRGFERVTSSLPIGEIERLRARARQLEAGRHNGANCTFPRS